MSHSHHVNSDFPDHWICTACAIIKGGTRAKEAYKCYLGTCPYCEGRQVVLTPWVDYDWPKNEQWDKEAKAFRD